VSAIGALRQRLAHQTYVDLPDGAGGIARTFLTVDQLWGRVEMLADDFGVTAERPQAGHRARVTLRAPNTVAPGDRLLLGARIFHVEAVADPDGRGRLARCRCREEQP
jgi:head-tail adaptor